MNIKYTIRPAARRDFERIDELYIEMLSSIYGGGSFSGYEDGYLDKFLPENGGGTIFTAATDDGIIAYLSLEYHFDENFAYIDDFCVEESCRGNGIGTALLRTAEEHAAFLRLDNVVLHAERSNKGAIRLYEKSGFVEFCGDESDSRIRMIKKSRR